MNDERSVEPWPAWVRYPVIAVLAAVAVLGIVAFLRSGVDAAVVRIVLVVVLVPLLMAPLQLWGLRRRSQRLVPRLDAELAGLEGEIERERAVEPARRSSAATDASLSRGADTVARARGLLVAGSEHEAAVLVRELGSSTGTSWSGALGRQLATCARTARTLEKVSRRAASSSRG